MSSRAPQPRSAPTTVVGRRDLTSLLRDVGHAGLGSAAALDTGVVVREKVEGIWLFAASNDALRDAVQRVGETSKAICTSWLLAPRPVLVGAVTKQLVGQGLSRDAVQTYLRAELRSGSLRGLAMLTQDYQPYFAVFRPDDQAEIDRQLDAVRLGLAKTGSVRPSDLPEPDVPRGFRAWRFNLLHHAEFLGLGRLVDGTLVGWRQ